MREFSKISYHSKIYIMNKAALCKPGNTTFAYQIRNSKLSTFVILSEVDFKKGRVARSLYTIDHILSMVLKSVDSNILILWPINNLFVDFVVCLGLLSCWKIH